MEFYALLAVIGASALAGALASRASYPTVLGYMLAGALFVRLLGDKTDTGPALELLGQLGLAMVGFAIGVEMRLEQLERVSRSLAALMMLDVAVITAFWLSASHFLGLDVTQAIIFALITLCSSTAAVYKSLSTDERASWELRHVIYTALILQDFIVILAISMLGGGGIGLKPTTSSLVAVALFLIIYRYGRKGARVFASLVSQGEVYVATALSAVLVFSALAGFLGLSPLLGGLAAGLLFGLFAEQRLASRLHGLMELGLVAYFSTIGAKIGWIPATTLLAMLMLTLVSVFVRVFSFSTALWLSGFNLRESLRGGVLMAPLSEYGVVLAGAAVSSGYLSGGHLLVTLLLVIFSLILSKPAAFLAELMYPRLYRALPASLVNFVEGPLRSRYTRMAGALSEIAWALLKYLSLLGIVLAGLTLLCVKLPLHHSYELRAGLIAFGLALVLVFTRIATRRILRSRAASYWGSRREFRALLDMVLFLESALFSLIFAILGLQLLAHILTPLEEEPRATLLGKIATIVVLVSSMSAAIYDTLRVYSTYKKISST